MHLNELVVESRNPGFYVFGSIVSCLVKLLDLLHLWEACFWTEMASCFAELQFTAEYSGECASQIPFAVASYQNSIAAHYGNTTDSAVDGLFSSAGESLLGVEIENITRCELREL